MRLISWNCNLLLSKKLDRLLALNPDVAVIQECEENFVIPDGYYFIWMGNNPKKGLGVLSKGLAIRCDTVINRDWTYFLPIVIPGLGIHLLATWAYYHRAKRFGLASIGNPARVLDQIPNWLSDFPSIMMGDFNNSQIWDKPHGPINFVELNRKLETLGLFSAYHQFSGERLGQETHPTFFHTKKVDAPYHIDYCFIHHQLSVSKVEIPDYSPWRNISDHVPLIVDLSLPL